MKWIIMTAVALTPAIFAQTPRVLTIEEAIAIGRQNSRALQVSEARASAALARSGEAHTALLPNLRLYGGYVRLSEGDFKLSSASLPMPLTVGPVVTNTYALRVGLQQPLFTGFRLHNNARAAEFQAEASVSDQKMEDADLVLNITSAYWSLYQAMHTKEYADENVARLESYRRDTERLMKMGLAIRNDLLKMDVQLATAKIGQIDARNDVQLASMNLNNLIGQPLDVQAVPGSDPQRLIDRDTVASMREGGGLAALSARAWDARQDLQAVSFLAEAAKASVSAAKGGYWPQIALDANYYYSRPNSRYQPVTDEFLASWDIGVQLQFDVWNWGKTARQAEQAEAALKQSEQQYAQLKDNITLEVQRASLGLRRSREKLGVAQLSVAQAEENRRLTADRYNNGLANSSDLLDAEVALIQAKTNYTGSLVEHALASARLVRALGEPIGLADGR